MDLTGHGFYELSIENVSFLFLIGYDVLECVACLSRTPDLLHEMRTRLSLVLLFEKRGVRFTCTASTRWPPLQMHKRFWKKFLQIIKMLFTKEKVILRTVHISLAIAAKTHFWKLYAGLEQHEGE